MVSSALIAAFVAGLLGSVHCVGMCGSFAVACGRVRGGLLAWHAGRVATYTLLGAAAGWVGRALPGPVWVPAVVAASLLVWFALALAGLVPEPRLIPPGLLGAGSRAAGTASVSAQFVFGLANGLLPCGLVYSAVSFAVAAAGPASGATLMLAFGIGTLPALSVAAVGLRRVLVASLWRRRVFASLMLGLGLWTIWNRSRVDAHAAHQHQRPPAAAGMTNSAAE